LKQYNIAEAKSHFSELVKLAKLGEDIMIARDNKPLLRLAPITEGRTERRPGSGKGQILAMSPEFDDLPADFKEYV
jgi:antitoxin (DNA-binding transcriptional repressor) of toxin-antitoxin stability system